jgi:hypothetical protein
MARAPPNQKKRQGPPNTRHHEHTHDKKARQRRGRYRRRFKRQQLKKEPEARFEEEILQEQEEWKNKEQNQRQEIWRKIKSVFGYLADYNKTRGHNASLYLSSMPFWYYFNKPSHLQFHDFTTTIKPPQKICRLLCLGLKFIPTPRWTQSGAATEFTKSTLNRFERDLILKGHFGPGPIPSYEAYNPRLYNKSAWIPPNWKIPAVVKQIFPAFSRQVKLLFKKKYGCTILLPFQRRALASLQHNPDLIVA